jgi:hypothetical protein
MGASVAFDIQNLTKRLDTLDAKGPTSRNIQSAFALAQTINSLLYEIAQGGAGDYTLSEDFLEDAALVAWNAGPGQALNPAVVRIDNRTNYEAAVDAARAAITTVFAELKFLCEA